MGNFCLILAAGSIALADWSSHDTLAVAEDMKPSRKKANIASFCLLIPYGGIL